MSLETIKEAVAKLVSESFKETLDEALEHRMSIFESKDEGEETPLKEEDEEEEDDSDDDEDKDDEEEDDEDSDTIEEALKITAKAVGSKNHDAPEKFEVKDMRELTKIVKTGKYGWLMVTKKNGVEDEYIVEKGKLVLL